MPTREDWMERRDTLTRRCCELMGWEYGAGLEWIGVRKAELGEAVAIHLDKFEEILKAMERVASESELHVAEINRRRGEMAVARAVLTELGIPEKSGKITLTMSQRIKLFAERARGVE